MPITDRLAAFIDRGTLAGAVVLVADRERVLEISAIGWADVAARKGRKRTGTFQAHVDWWKATDTFPARCPDALADFDR